jgi:hypothetical protein
VEINREVKQVRERQVGRGAKGSLLGFSAVPGMKVEKKFGKFEAKPTFQLEAATL